MKKLSKIKNKEFRCKKCHGKLTWELNNLLYCKKCNEEYVLYDGKLIQY